MNDPKGNVHYDFALSQQVTWSKNVRDSRNCPDQLILASVDHKTCIFLALGLWLEYFLGSNPEAEYMMTPNKPQGKTEKEHKKFITAIEKTYRKYALVLPIIKILAAHGDEHEVLGETECMEIFDSRNTGSSYKTLCRCVINFGLYKMNWIVARCDPTHPQYSEDPDVVRPWQNGVRFEVAMILRYLRPDFPVPRDNLFFCNDRDKQDFIGRRCYLGGVRLPDFPQRA